MDPGFREALKSVYEWPLVIITGTAATGWLRHCLLVLLWSFLMWWVTLAATLVLLAIEAIVKGTRSFKKQSLEREGLVLEKEVSEV